jgi:hypothetical protein
MFSYRKTKIALRLRIVIFKSCTVPKLKNCPERGFAYVLAILALAFCVCEYGLLEDPFVSIVKYSLCTLMLRLT